MVWIMIAVLLIVIVLAIITIDFMAGVAAEATAFAEQLRIEAEVRWAEHRLHGIARDNFAAMLDEARSNGPGPVG